jgi:hypothetical protein
VTPTLSLVIFIVAGGLAVVGQLLVLRDGLLGRTPAAGSTAAARTREGLWIAIPALALAATLWATWRALPHHAPRPTAPVAAPAPRVVS